MFLLFALSASAQPAYGQLYAGTPAATYPLYPRQVASAFGPRQVAPAFGPRHGPDFVPQPEDPFRFQLRQADRLVQASELFARGANLFYNVPGMVLFPDTPEWHDPKGGFGRFSNIAKGGAASLNEQRIQNEIDYYRRNHPQLTQEDREHLDDLVLQRESARNQKVRRFVATIPNTGIPATGGSVKDFFERRANENDHSFAKNILSDAREEYRKEQNQDNLMSVRNARDDVEQTDQRRDANTFDLLGTRFNNAFRLGPIYRKKASQTKLDIGYRTLRAAQQDFAKDPSEENRDQLRLARLFIDATIQEDDANKADVILAALPGISGNTVTTSTILSAKNFQDESGIWLKYDRLKRRILIKQHAQEAQKAAGASPVAQQMLGLSMYGRAPPTRPL
jgi:hypothetical protein